MEAAATSWNDCLPGNTDAWGVLPVGEDWNARAGGVDSLIEGPTEGPVLLMGMEEANDIFSRPLDGSDQAASAPMLGFNRSASAPDFFGMPGAPCLSSPRPGDLSSTEPTNILRAQSCA